MAPRQLHTMQPQTHIVALYLVCVILTIGWLPPPCIVTAQPQRAAGASGGAGSFTGEDLPCNAGDWPCWRGPKRNNHSADREPPTHWGRQRRVAWKSEISRCLSALSSSVSRSSTVSSFVASGVSSTADSSVWGGVREGAHYRRSSMMSSRGTIR